MSVPDFSEAGVAKRYAADNLLFSRCYPADTCRRYLGGNYCISTRCEQLDGDPPLVTADSGSPSGRRHRLRRFFAGGHNPTGAQRKAGTNGI
jgi:hypothetical protein